MDVTVIQSALDLLPRLEGKRVFVLGDSMMDRYVFGNVERFSPEAPVPILEETTRTAQLGAAANTCLNLRNLGAQVDLFSIVGEDESGREILERLKAAGVHTEGVVVDRSRPTTEKARIFGYSDIVLKTGQHLLRMDRESREPLQEPSEKKILELYYKRMQHADAVVIADYVKGFVTTGLAQSAVRVAHEQELPVVVNTKAERDADRIRLFEGAQALVLGEPEMHQLEKSYQIASGTRAWQTVRERSKVHAILVEQEDRGLALVRENSILNLPTTPGIYRGNAGLKDALSGIYALALCASKDPALSAWLCKFAGELVMKEVETQPVTLASLRKSMEEAMWLASISRK